MKRVLWWVAGGYMVPPIIWLGAGVYFRIWSAGELLRIVLSPFIWVYVGIFLGSVLALIRRRMARAEALLETSPQQAARQINAVPLIFLAGMAIYCVIGPNVALLGQTLNAPFLDSTEYLFAELLGIPLILMFTVPFFLGMTRDVERAAIGVTLDPRYRFIGLRGKMIVGFVLNLIGTIITILIAALSYAYAVGEALSFGPFAGYLALVATVVLVVALVNMAFMVRQLIGPVARLNTGMSTLHERLSRKSGTLDLTTDVCARDEVGQLASYFGGLLLSLKELVAEIKELSERTQAAAETMSAGAEESIEHLDTTKEYNAVVTREHAALAEDLEETDRQTRSAREELVGIKETAGRHRKLLGEIAESMALTRSDASTTREGADSNSRAFESLIELARRGSVEMRENSKLATEVVGSAGVIGQALDVINDIADQTSLLAMNASIQAAHAGEAGLGFAVVAGEIRVLSENTHKQAGSITESLEELVEKLRRTEVSGRRTEELFASMQELVEGERRRWLV